MSLEISTERVGVPLADITAGVLRFAESAGRHVTEATFAVYAEQLSGEMTPSEWEQVADEAIRTVDGWPSIARLLRILRDQREARADEPTPEAELVAEERRRDAKHRGQA